MAKACTLKLLPLVLIVLLVACGTEPAQRVLAPSAEFAARSQGDDDTDGDGDGEGDERPQFSAWSAPVNLGPVVNSEFLEQNPGISKDGLSLYFGSTRPGIGTGFDLWVSRRARVEAPWGPPKNVGPVVNAPAPFSDNAPTLSRDGRLLFFGSNRPSGFGAGDLYVSRRRDKRDDLGWEVPVNLGGAVNTPAGDNFPAYVEDDATGTITLYFSSNRPLPGEQCGTPGLPACDNDIYVSTMLPDGTFGPAVPVTELNSPGDDQRTTIRRDGLEIFLASDRPGTLGGMDIWVATRERTSDPWSTPVNLGAPVNTVNFDAGPALSFDARTLYFHSASRAGNVGGPFFDLWVTTRDKLRGGDGHDDDGDDDDEERRRSRRR